MSSGGTAGTGTAGTGTAGTGTSGSATSGGSGGTGTAGSGGSPSGPTEDLVDDLEDADGRIIVTQGRQGNWFTFSDGTVNPAGPNDTANTNGFAPQTGGYNGSAYAAHAQASGFPNYAGLALDLNNVGVRPKDTANRNVYDVSAYDGFAFYAKGSASGQVRAMAVTKEIAGTTEAGTCDDSNTANDCWDSWGQNFSVPADWTEVRVQFSAMTSGNKSPFDKTAVFGFVFQLNGQNGNLDLWVDNVRLFKNAATGAGGASGSGAGGTGTSGSGAGGTGTSGAGAGGKGGAGAGGMSGAAGSAGASTCTNPPPPVQGGTNGWASRYWDCCKPACGWKANVKTGNAMASCSQQNQSLGPTDAANACPSGGSAFMCWSDVPWSVCDKLSYGFAAVGGNNYTCGRCYQLQFDGGGHSGTNPGATSLNGKTMIVQVINNGGVDATQFDLLIPGGGVGALNACGTQWGSSVDLGSQYGGLFAECNDDKTCTQQKCQAAFGDKPDLLAGCNWFLGWFNGADNPTFTYKQVACPSALTQKSGLSDPG
jgi:hypothetical protein